MYHHASNQTTRKPKESKEVKLTRETQTYIMKALTQQTVREAATQMPRPGLLLTEDDRVIYPGEYMTADAYHELKVRMVSTHNVLRSCCTTPSLNLLRLYRCG